MEHWPVRDRELALALTQMEDETGPEGHPIADEMDPASDGWWEPKAVYNYAVAARQQFMKSEAAKELEPGAMIVIRDGRQGAVGGDDSA